jgi:hypothetical protein
VARRAPVLIDARWEAIQAAAAPHVGSDQARADIDEALYAYSGLLRDPEQLAVERERWRRIAKLARALAAELFAVKRQTPWRDDDPDRPMRDLKAARVIEYRAENYAEGLDMMVRSRQGRQDPARAWLYWRLFQIWSECFGGVLAVTVPPDGGPPSGPLVRFVLAVTADVLDPPATPYAIRSAVRRERPRR